MAKTLTAAALVSSASIAAGGTSRGRLDCTGADGGELRVRMKNGATGPTEQCVCTVTKARKQSSMPAAGAPGTGDDDWKIVYQVGGSVTANVETTFTYSFGPETGYIQVEFTGHTGQAVTAECTGDTYAY